MTFTTLLWALMIILGVVGAWFIVLWVGVSIAYRLGLWVGKNCLEVVARFFS